MKTHLSEVQLQRAKLEDKETVRNLMSLYIHDLSAFTDDLDIDEHGTFHYEGLDLYWEREGLIPYLIKAGEKLVGFVLLNSPPFAPPDRDFYVNELFVLKKYRGKGYAKAAIQQVFTMHPGRYLVLQLVQNTPAISFWHRLYAELDITYEETQEDFHGEACVFQRFEIEGVS